ncbi:MAG: sigma-54 interaction domain-containing protein [Pseudomonadota bacterium]
MNKLLTFPDPQAHPLSVRARALVFDDPLSARILTTVERVAPTEAALLIIGETGTGKELIARHLHEHSGRKGPFVAINCGAFNETLIESELFGYEAGAFTGALKARSGWFEAAHGGTLFLDEIGDLPLSQQVKLLRVLQERQVVRVGSRTAIDIDVRLVAATNVDLTQAVEAGHFRRDLWYRLNVATVDLPPLRRRPGDILPLAAHFIRQYSQKLQLPTATLAEDARAALLHYPWPGNIRELENVIHYALIVGDDGIIRQRDLKFAGIACPDATAPSHLPASATHEQGLQEVLHRLIDQSTPDLFSHVETMLVNTAYEFCEHNQVRTARLLGISRNILRSHLMRLNILPRRQASQQHETDIEADSSFIY